MSSVIVLASLVQHLEIRCQHHAFGPRAGVPQGRSPLARWFLWNKKHASQSDRFPYLLLPRVGENRARQRRQKHFGIPIRTPCNWQCCPVLILYRACWHLVLGYRRFNRLLKCGWRPGYSSRLAVRLLQWPRPWNTYVICNHAEPVSRPYLDFVGGDALPFGLLCHLVTPALVVQIKPAHHPAGRFPEQHGPLHQ